MYELIFILFLHHIEMKVVTDSKEQLFFKINLLPNDIMPLHPPSFRHEDMPFSQSHQVGQTPTRSHQGIMTKVVQPAQIARDQTKNSNRCTPPLSSSSTMYINILYVSLFMHQLILHTTTS